MLELVLCLGSFAGSALAFQDPADLVIRGGEIYTGTPGPAPEAVAIDGDRIVALGTEEEIAPRIGPDTRVIDASGQFVMPGFIESHAHLLSIGRSSRTLDLVGTESVEQVLELVRGKAESLEEGEWILGRGWDQNDWPSKEFPTADQLEQASLGHPALLTRIDGHAAWVNRKALERARLSRETVDPSGGEILRGAEGRPSGVLIDHAISLVSRFVPDDTESDRERDLRAAVQECLRLGITSFHDAGVSQRDIELFERAIEEGWLPIRIYAMLAGSSSALLERYFDHGPIVGRGAGLLTVRSIKLYADGALGSRGAALLEDYAD
ncbi:MAG: amidohydrolase family protein, partial [Planctomycetota bacterium]